MPHLTLSYYDIPAIICIIAGAIYALKNQELKDFEKLILLIIGLNIITDISSFFLALTNTRTHIFYNILIPIERILTLIIYLRNVNNEPGKKLYYIAVAAVFGIYIISYFNNGNLTELHNVSNITTGLILASLSYIQLRSILMGGAGDSSVLIYFGLANLIYYTLMISAMSALPLALQISQDFASDIYDINIVGYTLWSIILIIGILWKKQKI